MTPAEARRAILLAQGLAVGRPTAVTARSVGSVIRRTHVLQIDSVNVLTRAHYLPVFSRIGPYDRAVLDRSGARAPRTTVEYWAHEASMVPVSLHPFLRWRMAESHAWAGVADAAADNPALVADVLAAVGELGPVTASELEVAVAGPARGERTNWGWNWSVVKRALEHLFWSGGVSSAGRDSSFRRRYALPERVLPRKVLAAPTPARPDAIRALVERAGRALGVATAADLQDYFRLPSSETKQAISELAESGDLVATEIPGWPATWRHRTARAPRTCEAAALLVPFDPLIWDRRRVLRVFGMAYRIEIYVPADKREYGYYVLPFLLGDRLVARVDLKSDRGTGTLLVRSSWVEPGIAADEVVEPLAAELQLLAEWLGLSSVRVLPHGTLAAALTPATN